MEVLKNAAIDVLGMFIPWWLVVGALAYLARRNLQFASSPRAKKTPGAVRHYGPYPPEYYAIRGSLLRLSRRRNPRVPTPPTAISALHVNNMKLEIELNEGGDDLPRPEQWQTGFIVLAKGNQPLERRLMHFQ